MKTLFAFVLAFALSASVHAASATFAVGSSISISVNSDGTPPFTYQWKKDGADIAGANGPTYSITSAKATDAGVYTVSVTNPVGSALSDTATITVFPVVVPVTKATTAISVTPPKGP